MMEAENKVRDTLQVIVCRADEFAKVVEIEDSLEAMQDLVGGFQPGAKLQQARLIGASDAVLTGGA